MTRAGARVRIILAALLFSTGGAAIKFVDFSSWQVACLRSAVAAVALWFFLPRARRHWDWRIFLVGSIYAATMIMFVTANKLTTAANAIFLQNTSPLYLLLLGPWLLREPITRRDLGFFVLVGVGLSMFFIAEPAPAASAPNPLAGNLLALATGLSWAFTVAGLRWVGRSDRSAGGDAPGATAVAGNVIACLVCLPLALPLPTPSASADWLVILYLGVLQIGLAYMFLTGAMKVTPALEAALLLLVEPVFNPLWAWLVQGERPGAWALAGGTLIIAATALKAWLDTRSGEIPVPPPLD